MLKVPGATLYHEFNGSGPVLLLICGGVYDDAALASQLADRYTVVTYDRRGNSRSPLDGPPAPQSIEVHVDDAHRLLLHVAGDRPAYVFGNSSGAIIGLDLAARHPSQVRTLIAHEPPLFELLPNRDHWHTVIQDIEDTFAREGAGPAGEVLGAAFAHRNPSGRPDSRRRRRRPTSILSARNRRSGQGFSGRAALPPGRPDRRRPSRNTTRDLSWRPRWLRHEPRILRPQAAGSAIPVAVPKR